MIDLTPIHIVALFTTFIVLFFILAYAKQMREVRKLRAMALRTMAENGDTTDPKEVSVKITGTLLLMVVQAVSDAFFALGLLLVFQAALDLI